VDKRAENMLEQTSEGVTQQGKSVGFKPAAPIQCYFDIMYENHV